MEQDIVSQACPKKFKLSQSYPLQSDIDPRRWPLKAIHKSTLYISEIKACIFLFAMDEIGLMMDTK